MPERVIWWLRRDLRLDDNSALGEALQTGAAIIPVFILDDRLLNSPYSSTHRIAFLLEGLHRLDASLRNFSSYLVVRRGDPVQELSRLLAETEAGAIYAELDVSPYAVKRDRSADACLPMCWAGSPAIHHPGSVLKSNGEPYTTFTPFSKAWKALPLPQVEAAPFPAHLHTPTGLSSLPLPETPRLSPDSPFVPGEGEARNRLQEFIDTEIGTYASQRNRLDLPGTSGLSPYLRFGMLSPRRVYCAAADAATDEATRQSAETWLNELVWRDFYLHILYHFPRVREGNFRPIPVRWLNDPADFQRWCNGETGYPVVDAAMRCLLETGWMHNRARMIVASFLNKHLLIDWRWGERWFMQHLIDGDPASNNGGWQWCAGTGTDAAPYFRIFNPLTQGQVHDPHGSFVRRWLPELGNVPTDYVHAPWTMPAEVQRAAGCRIGNDYPAPVVDHAFARRRALAAYTQKQLA